MFGQHFASMDVRQDSRVLRRAAEAAGITEGDDVAGPDGHRGHALEHSMLMWPMMWSATPC